MKKFFKKIHLWISIPFGIPIAIICLTGAILLFEKDVAKIQNPHLYKVEAEGSALDMTQLLDSATKQLGNEVKINSITKSNSTTPYYLSIKGSKSQYAINQYNGKILGSIEKSEFFRQVFYLHRWFFDAPTKRGEMSIGKIVVATSTIVMIISLISGIIIWIPKNVKGIRNRLKISIDKGWKRFWYDTHIAMGFYSALILLIISITGLTWSFSTFNKVFYSVITTPEREKSVQEEQHKIYTTIKIDGYEDVQVKDSSITVPQSARWWVYNLHTGGWAGSFSKWIYFIIVLTATSLPITGYWIWWRKNFSKSKIR